jgi:hypothetical protein
LTPLQSLVSTSFLRHVTFNARAATFQAASNRLQELRQKLVARAVGSSSSEGAASSNLPELKRVSDQKSQFEDIISKARDKVNPLVKRGVDARGGDALPPLSDILDNIAVPSVPRAVSALQRDAISQHVSPAHDTATPPEESAAHDVNPDGSAFHARQGLPLQPFTHELVMFNAALVKTFPKLSPAAIDSVMKNATRRIGTPGLLIFKEGDMSSDMIFLVSGRLDVSKQGQHQANIDGGTIVGHHSYMYMRPRSATVTVSHTKPGATVFYNFTADPFAAETDEKSHLRLTASTRVVMGAKRNSLADALQSRADLVVVESTGDLSPDAKMRMASLLGEVETGRRHSPIPNIKHAHISNMKPARVL